MAGVTPREGNHTNLHVDFSSRTCALVFLGRLIISPRLKYNHVLSPRRAIRDSGREPVVSGTPELDLFKPVCSLHPTL